MLHDLYGPTTGWLHRLDPRTKLGLEGVAALLFLTASGPVALALLLAALHGLLLTSRVPWSRLRWVVVQLRWVLGVILLLFPWMAAEQGGVLLRLGPLALTEPGLWRAAEVALRLWGMSLLVSALLFTTGQQELVRGLVALGLPYRWGLTLALTLRYIPTVASQIEQIQEAQATRGWDPARGGWLQRLRGLGPVLVALVIYVFRTVDTLTLAMAARGVGRGTIPTARQPLRMARRDWVALSVGAGIVIAWLMRLAR